jgi:hypothetical protein
LPADRTASKDSAGKFHGYVWERGRFTTIDVPGAVLSKGVFTRFDVPGVPAIFPFGLNDRGQIVGLAEIPDTSQGQSARG